MKTASLTLVRIIFLPFLIIAFGWSYLRLVVKAKHYIDGKNEDPFGERFARVAKLVRFYFYLRGIQTKADFVEKLPTRRPVLLVVNHKSWLDPLALIHAISLNWKESEKETKFAFTFVAKIELRKHSLGKILSYIDCVFLDRTNLRQAFECLKAQTKLIKKNISICVFPEGTRIHGDEFGEFKSGAIKVALKNFVPILPVAIYGSDELNRRSRFNFLKLKPSVIQLQFERYLDTFAYAEANPEFLVNNIRDKIYIMYKSLKENKKGS